MAKFFFRNAPNTVKDAVELSEEQFIKKYSDTTASPETLAEAYKQLRDIHIKPNAPTKEVTFKVVQTDEKVVPITRKIRELADEPESITTVVDNTKHPKEKTNSGRGRKRLQGADQRDARIRYLLQQGKKGKEVLEIMKEEGFSVHAPQITIQKQLMEAEGK